MNVARVLPNVAGLDKRFDYLVPEHLAGDLHVGSLVRVDLHGRRVGGWVTALLDQPADGIGDDALKPIAKVTGRGPDSSIFELAEWATRRWAARRPRPFLVAASPVRAVLVLPRPRWTGTVPDPVSPATENLLASGGGVLRLPPRADIAPVVHAAMSVGPALVVVATNADAFGLASRLRRAGASVAVVPDDWAAAASGVDVVIGTRTAAWAPCPSLAAAVVVDEHDEALQEERSPTWHARDVVVERCRRAGVPVVLVSSCPTLVAVEEYAGPHGVVHPPAERERAGWPRVTVVDRTNDDPWKKSLVTSELIEVLRDRSLRVLCISNITGRARVLACRSCRSLVRCERCDAAVGMASDRGLECRRCGDRRPPVCQECGASRFANLRPGVTRLREELEAAAARPVGEIVTGSADLPNADVLVGTEAGLYRIPPVDVIAFLEFDSEMLAPRFRAAEQALALIVRAGRRAERVLVQTFVPNHMVLRAAMSGDPALILDDERTRRQMIGLPPYGALAAVSGAGAEDYVASVRELSSGSQVAIGGDAERGFVVRAPDWDALGDALNAGVRPSGARLRIEVDPARL